VNQLSVLVSVIIPVYNSSPYLESCLQSVLNQSYQQLEVIVINDGSTDNSQEIIEQFIKIDKRIKMLTQENHGLGYTRNRGIYQSTGKFIFFLDSDDELPKNAIEKLVNSALTYNADYAVGKVLRFNTERRYIPVRHTEFNLYDKNEATTLSEKTELLQDSIACNKLWKKEFITKNSLSFIEGRYYEDLEMTLKAAVLAKKIAIVKETVYLWRVRDNEDNPSITQQQMKLKNTSDRLSALEANRNWLIRSGISTHIVAEHNLKALFDIIRLHVLKFSLIDAVEMEEWKNRILSFLNQIPQEVAQKLPSKEKRLYNLIMNQQFSDLELFSRMYTNTEIHPIVKQQGLQFFIQGEDQTYDVTYDLKPTMVMKEIKKSEGYWHLSGEVTIPKACIQTAGHFYAVNRDTKEVVKLDPVEFEPTGKTEIYHYENQLVKTPLNPQMFSKANEQGESIYDFYFRLSWNDQQHRPTRVRVNLSAELPASFTMRQFYLSLYRTNNGNLSIKVTSASLKTKLKNLLKKLFK
jgi:glycosyltransferase involved in cell wall biosynthesis